MQDILLRFRTCPFGTVLKRLLRVVTCQCYEKVTFFYLYHSVNSDLPHRLPDSPMTPDYAWAHREGRNTRYDNKRVGGTVCVHFIKKNMWFLETALTFLEMEDTTELEMHPSRPNDEENELPSVDSSNRDSNKSSFRPEPPSKHLDDPDSATVDVEVDPVDLNTKKHGVPTLPTKGIHVLLVQSGAEGLPIRVEGGGARIGDPVILPVDEPERLEGIPGGDHKREVDSGAPGERDNQATTVSPPAGHFSNGSRRVNNR